MIKNPEGNRGNHLPHSNQRLGKTEMKRNGGRTMAALPRSLQGAFLFSLALGIARLRINQPNPQNPAGPLHPLVFVLRAIVEIVPAGNPVFENGFVEGVLHHKLRHGSIEFSVKNVSGGVIQQTGKVCGGWLSGRNRVLGEKQQKEKHDSRILQRTVVLFLVHHRGLEPRAH